jgi:hypothetical protein
MRWAISHIAGKIQKDEEGEKEVAASDYEIKGGRDQEEHQEAAGNHAASSTKPKSPSSSSFPPPVVGSSSKKRRVEGGGAWSDADILLVTDGELRMPPVDASTLQVLKELRFLESML